ncbi:peptidoglycan DD-metalloendopeptidase family protein [Shewanella gaetbuli]|uniref:Peptidoglycan DD-metalloendopeptidase family protein n=1 Tax=Shewanella gaetbuli TaxID=220752 RepID=A0A9X2CHA7_9GAMM|nr:peptidoglycan DD-metalloendopeptidase family protein [Shewanella gaetbuli]MCL1141827.1 peptidoglycan DD-metalloendopeptidase family protein [Shewanella gaetbuli]
MYSGWSQLLIVLLLTGCSLQSQQPAPVENASASPYKPKYQRGSITNGVYTVKKGDTLYSISWGAGRNFTDVAKQNNLKKPYVIYPGQKLKLTDAKTKSPVKKITPSRSVKTTNSTTKPSKIAKNSQQASVNKDKSLNDNRSKKVLDQKANSAYSVTTTQQTINQGNKPPVAELPNKVRKWLWPVNGKIIGYFSSSEQGNQGIKVAGNRGDIIKAAADGRVVYAGNALRGYGNLVIIKHNDEYLSAYAHTDKILVKEKQFVSAGQTIAQMGSTGASQVMLHFEIRYHGKSVNPLRYLPKQ